MRTEAITRADLTDLVNLYHLARVAGKESRYDRLCWAVRQYARRTNSQPSTRAYKAVDHATRPI